MNRRLRVLRGVGKDDGFGRLSRIENFKKYGHM